MEKEVLHNIHNAMEILDKALSERDSKTDLRNQNQADKLSDKATDPPMNHGDCINMIEELPGPSPKTKPQVKRSRKRTDILLILRESLHRESKSIAKEKIRNAIKERRTNPISKISWKKLRGRKIRKRILSKKNQEVKGRNIVLQKRVIKKKRQGALRLSPVSYESSGSASKVWSKGSTGSVESQSIESQSIETETDSRTSRQ